MTVMFACLCSSEGFKTRWEGHGPSICAWKNEHKRAVMSLKRWVDGGYRDAEFLSEFGRTKECGLATPTALVKNATPTREGGERTELRRRRPPTRGRHPGGTGHKSSASETSPARITLSPEVAVDAFLSGSPRGFLQTFFFSSLAPFSNG